MKPNTKIYKIIFNPQQPLNLIIEEESTDNPREIYFKEYKELFTKEEWGTISLFEDEIIPLINQLDEIDRNTPIKNYERNRDELNKIWETYELEREAIRLQINQVKIWDNGITLKRIQ